MLPVPYLPPFMPSPLTTEAERIAWVDLVNAPAATEDPTVFTPSARQEIDSGLLDGPQTQIAFRVLHKHLSTWERYLVRQHEVSVGTGYDSAGTKLDAVREQLRLIGAWLMQFEKEEWHD